MNDEGALTISGTGDMPNFNLLPDRSTSAGWKQYADQIKKVVIEDGITSIGDDTFSDCESLKEITLPATLKTVGLSALANCNSLTTITCQRKEAPILLGTFVFGLCRNLTNIYIPEGVTGYTDANG